MILLAVNDVLVRQKQQASDQGRRSVTGELNETE